MANISKIRTVDGTAYDIKDAAARTSIANLGAFAKADTGTVSYTDATVSSATLSLMCLQRG